MLVVGLALHNVAMAQFWDLGVRGTALDAVAAWKEVLLLLALAVVAWKVRRLPAVRAADVLAAAYAVVIVVYWLLPQDVLGGDATARGELLALRHHLFPVAAYALGRIGCFLVNDDYGRPTTLPWGMKFPQGMPPSTVANLRDQFGVALPADLDPTTVLAVHPTQLYEAGLMLAAFAVLWAWRDRAKGLGWLFGLYLVFALFGAAMAAMFGPGR